MAFHDRKHCGETAQAQLGVAEAVVAVVSEYACAFGRLALTAAVLFCLPAPAGAQTSYEFEKTDFLGKPGTIIRVWPQLGAGPSGSNAYRLLYRSTGLKGQPIAVSGAVFLPSGPAPAQGRPVVAWAHPTSGVVYRCGPSLLPDLEGTVQGPRSACFNGCVLKQRLDGDRAPLMPIRFANWRSQLWHF